MRVLFIAQSFAGPLDRLEPSILAANGSRDPVPTSFPQARRMAPRNSA